MSHSLLTLFAPPDGYAGDFGMFCGFTASRDVLERIARTFSGDASRPRLAAFIHPTAAAVTDLPGIAWMHFRSPLRSACFMRKSRCWALVRQPDIACGLRSAPGTGPPSR